MSELKPCPFCGGSDIRYSVKIAMHRGNKKQHRIAMYCWDCNCYGARTVIDTSGRNRYEVERDLRLVDIAIEAWNRRTTIETNIYDKEETYPNCTVQVLTNTATGEVSVGWWRNGGAEDGS